MESRSCRKPTSLSDTSFLEDKDICVINPIRVLYIVFLYYVQHFYTKQTCNTFVIKCDNLYVFMDILLRYVREYRILVNREGSCYKVCFRDSSGNFLAIQFSYHEDLPGVSRLLGANRTCALIFLTLS